MSITPTVLIAGSGLLNNQALSIDTDYRSDTTVAAYNSNVYIMPFLARINSTWSTLPTSYKDRVLELFGDYPFILQGALTNPGTADYQTYNILYNVNLAQSYVSNVLSSITNKSRRINYMFNQVAPLVYGAEETYAAIGHYKGKSWDDISLDAKDHSDLATNGILRVLLTGSDDQIDNIKLLRQQLRDGETLNDVAGRRLALLSKALRNLGTLYDPDDLANMGKAKTLIENMYSLGLSRVGNLNQLILDLEISSLDDIRDQYLAQVLTKITGKALADIIDRTGVVLANAGHFDVEINLNALKEHSSSVDRVREHVESYKYKDKEILVLAEGRLVNLAAATGHPASVMDMSFANQALAAEWIKDNYKNLESKVYTLPKEVDLKIAATKLGLMGGELEILTEEQINYLDSWEHGTS